MKRTICIVSSCITLAVFMMVQTFAVASYNAYSYWSTATNSIGFIGGNISSNFGYSRISGFKPPADLQSDFYKNGYYSNSMALFSGTTTGTATFDLLGKEVIASWMHQSGSSVSPTENGFTSTQFNKMTSNGFLINYDSNLYATNTKLTYNSDGQPVLIYDFEINLQTLPKNGDHCTGCIPIVFAYEGVSRISSLSFFQGDNSDYFLYVNGVDSGDVYSVVNYPTNYRSLKISSLNKVQINLNQTYNISCIAYGKTVDWFLDGNLIATVSTQSAARNNNTNCYSGIFSAGACFLLTEYSIYQQVLPTSTILVNLSKSITISAGNDFEFYMNMRSGSVTNVTQGSTADFVFDGLSQISWIFSDDVTMSPISASGYWLYCKLPAADRDRTLSSLYFTFSTPYVNMNTGDEIRWDMALTLSDVVIGKSADIGYNPDVDPNENQFRNEVLGGINDVKQEIHDGFDIINGTLEDVRQEIQDGFDMVEDALSRDDNFEDVTASPDADIEHVVPESDALIQYEQIMADANQTLLDADLLGAQSFWQDVFNSVLTIPMAGMMAVISSSLLILRALLGR